MPSIAGAQQRALEPVSPVNSQGIEPYKTFGYGSADGNRAFWLDQSTIFDIKVGTRTPDGWTTRTIPAQIDGDAINIAPDFSPDMATFIWTEFPTQDAVPGFVGTGGLFVDHDGHVTEISRWSTPTNTTPHAMYLAGSQDRSQLVIQAPGVFGAASSSGLYRWSVGHGAEPINVDMSRYAGADCNTAPGEPDGFYDWRNNLATIGLAGPGMSGVSPDGSTVVVKTPSCTDGGSPVPSHLVIWHDNGASTDITVPVAGGQDGDAKFVGMTPNGSRVYFTTTAQLEPSDGNGAKDLYVWENGQLTRLTEGELAKADMPGSDLPDQVQVSHDGSTVWFQADDPVGGLGQAGQHNIFAWDGHLQLVGTFASAPQLTDSGDYYRSQLSEDGRYLVYTFYNDPVTGASYGNSGTNNFEVIRIGRDGSADCISCPPSYTNAPIAPNSPRYVDRGSIGATRVGDANNAPGGIAVAWIPLISRDGSTIAFETGAALDPRDTNHQVDTYVWENGHRTLVSSGTEVTTGANMFTDDGGLLAGMSADGSSIFFTQAGPLAPGVTDPYRKMWVSRVGGGFPAPQPPAECGAGCQGAPTAPPALPDAASVTSTDPGNLPPAPSKTVPPSVGKPSGTVHGTSAVIRVKVAGAGVIRISGARIATVKRTVSKAGTYSIRVTLSKTWQRSLARHKTLTAGVKVQFTPKGGKAASRTVLLRFARKAASKKAAR